METGFCLAALEQAFVTSVPGIFNYSGPRNLDRVISYTWDIKRGGPSGTNAQELSAFI
jgi:hypothetical protein